MRKEGKLVIFDNENELKIFVGKVLLDTELNLGLPPDLHEDDKKAIQRTFLEIYKTVLKNNKLKPSLIGKEIKLELDF